MARDQVGKSHLNEWQEQVLGTDRNTQDNIPMAGGTARILVVDDDDDVRKVREVLDKSSA
jgi:hypothetical protein